MPTIIDLIDYITVLKVELQKKEKELIELKKRLETNK